MGKSRKWLWLSVGVVIFLLNVASFSWAEFTYTPSILLREEYNDNIHLTPTDRRSDFVTTINPIITLAYTSSLLTLALDYGFEFKIYARNHEDNETNLTDAQRAKLETTVSLYKDIVKLRVFDQYWRVPKDVREATAIGNTLVNMTDSNLLDVNPYMEYPLTGSLKARVSYDYTNQWYRDSLLSKYQSHTIEAGLIKELSQKITVTALYDYIITNYTNQVDYTRQNAKAGIQYQVTPKLSLGGTGGYTWFDFQELGNRSYPIWSANVKYDATNTLSLTASYLVDFFNSTSGIPFTALSLSQYYSTVPTYPVPPYLTTYYSATSGLHKQNSASAGVYYSGNIPIAVTFTYEKDKYPEVTGGREDEWKGVTISTSKPFTQKITGQLVGFYTNYTFLPENEKAKRYGVNVDLAYAFKIATLHFGYTYNKNNSNIDANDYSNNIVYLEARFVL